MPPSVDSPIQTRLPLPVPDGVLGSGRRPAGRRRIFVQTDTGSVLGIELDRSDNVQTVKKKMQTMLNVPIEQTALVFGDTVFKSDLSELRNDSPLLLTRHLQRSLSTPCIYPAEDTQMLVDGDQPFEVVGGMTCCEEMKGIINDIVKAIQCGVEPVAASGGLGGAYYFRNCSGESVAVVKPTDEEPFAPNNPKGYVGRNLGQPGLKKAVRVGETGVREVAAYLLDHEQFAKVPPTVLVKVSHHAFHVNGAATVQKEFGKSYSPVAKIASCQQFVYHDYDASDHGSSRFSVGAVHRIGILDVRIFNTDRHAGNILVRNTKTLDNQRTWSTSNVYVNESLDLIPIDHGLCLPEAFEDPYFEWLHWPQSSLPFSEEELDYIERLDEYKDADMLRCQLPMLREACFRMLILSTSLLKIAAAHGLCLAEIGEMMSRDGLDEASQLELLCMQAKIKVEEELEAENLNECDALSETSVGEDRHEQFDFDDDDHQFPNKVSQMLSRSIMSPVCYPFGPASRFTLPMPLPLQNHTAKYQYASQGGLSILHEVSQDVEQEDLRIPISKSSGSGVRISGTQSLAFDSLSLRGKSHTRSLRSNQGLKARASFCPLVEEDEVVDFPECTRKSGISSRKADCEPPQAMSYKSVSFSNRKQRYDDYTNRKTPVSEITAKVNIKGGLPLSLGDMNEEEWTCFMYHFKEALDKALATQRNRNMTHRQRLGISCQF